VKRYRRNLEAKAGEQKHQAEHNADAAGFHGCRDAGKADRSCKAVDQGSAIQQHAG
jgi:hypothetical protein